jgi:arginine:pyruvate transaminase
VAVLGSLSKSHRMSGYRLGWVAGPPALIEGLHGWSAAATFSVCQFVQDAGLVALALPAEELRPYWQGFARRAALVAGRVAGMPGLAMRAPEGGMFVMLDVRGVMADDLAFAEALLDAAGVAVLPGRAFGASAAGHVRLTLTPGEAVLARALDGIATFAAGTAAPPLRSAAAR